MIETSTIFIPIPKRRNTHAKIEITSGTTTTDIVGRTLESEWVKPSNNGIGIFKLKMANAMGQYTDSFTRGDTIKFYADNTDGTYLQFHGRIDILKENISRSGQFLEIEGRHKGYISSETLICHSATDTDPAQILKDIIDKYLAKYGFTYTNINSTSITMSVEWNYKPFWQCVNELCNKAGFDARLDNDLDMHFIAANTVTNENEAVAEIDNFISLKDWGTDDYYERTRVVAIGQDYGGLPIIYTAISDNEGSESDSDIREVFIKDISADTEDKVQAIAEAKLSELENQTPQALTTSFGLETLEPTENIWFVIPRKKIYGQYKVIEVTHKFGMKTGGWRTDCLIEKQIGSTSEILQDTVIKQQNITQAVNPNKLNYTYNFPFKDNSKTSSHSGTQVTGDRLILSSQSSVSGTWISSNKVVDQNVTNVELRVNGKDLFLSEFYFSLNNGVTWESISVDDFSTLITPDSIGRNIKIKAKLIRSTSWLYLNPEIGSIVLLYS